MKKQFKWDRYIELVNFIGECLGDNVEVALHDLTTIEHSVIAICNGHVTGRSIGAPLTIFALNKIQEEDYKNKERIMNYKGTAKNGNLLRSSSLYIRDDEDKVVGMLCVNVDVSEYKKVGEMLKKLSFVAEVEENGENGVDSIEKYPNSIKVMVSDVMKEIMSGNSVQVDRLTSDEKTEIVGKLIDKGLFQIKGAVSEVAEMLYTSEATIYRYIGKVNKKNRK